MEPWIASPLRCKQRNDPSPQQMMYCIHWNQRAYWLLVKRSFSLGMEPSATSWPSLTDVYENQSSNVWKLWSTWLWGQWQANAYIDEKVYSLLILMVGARPCSLNVQWHEHDLVLDSMLQFDMKSGPNGHVASIAFLLAHLDTPMTCRFFIINPFDSKVNCELMIDRCKQKCFSDAAAKASISADQ